MSARSTAAFASLFGLCLLPSAARADRLDDILADMARLAASQQGTHPLDAREAERRLQTYGPEVAAMPPEAAPRLGRALNDPARPLKVRLYAAAFLGLHGDPGSLTALKECLRDSRADPGLRAAALQSVSSLRLRPDEVRRVLDGAAGDPSAPSEVTAEALAGLSIVGTDDLPGMARLARRAGAEPERRFRDQADARHAVRALALSRDPSAAGVLLDLLRFFAWHSPLKAEVLRGLLDREDVHSLSPRDRESVVLAFERGTAPAPALAVRLLGRAAARESLKTLLFAAERRREPAVIAEAAEALATLPDPAAADMLRRLAAGLVSDPRFAPTTEEPDTARLAARVERAFLRLTAAPDRVVVAGAPAPAADGLTAAARILPTLSPAAPTMPPLPRPAPPPQNPDLARPPTPALFRFHGWPGEGIPHFYWNGKEPALPLSAEPDPSAPTTPILLSTGVAVEYDDSVVLTRELGRAVAKGDLSLEARLHGETLFISSAALRSGGRAYVLRLSTGQPVEILAHRGEGSCFLRSLGQVSEAPCPWFRPQDFELLSQPRTEWWLHRGGEEGSGWFRARHEGLDLLQRTLLDE